MSRVRDIVHDRELFHVEESSTVAEAARKMAELRVGAILVLTDGHVAGVFSERDIMHRVVLEGRDPSLTFVRQVMSTSLTTVDELATLEEAMELMSSHGYRHLPVMRGNHAVGFLSMRDLMKYELERKTEELHHMRAYIHGSA